MTNKPEVSPVTLERVTVVFELSNPQHVLALTKTLEALKAPGFTDASPVRASPSPSRQITSVENLLECLRVDLRRDAYEGADGKFYVSYQGGKVERSAINEAEKLGVIVRRYPGRPDLNAWSLPSEVKS